MNISFNPRSTGQKIRRLRLSHKISQQTLSNHIDVTRAYISYIERGERIATVEIYMAIAVYFNVTLDYLLYDQNGQPPKKSMNTIIKALEDIESDLK